MQNGKNASMLFHLRELRRRLLYSIGFLIAGFFLSFAFANEIFTFLTHPLLEAFGTMADRRLIFTGLAEKFFTNVKLAFFTAFMITFPVIANQIWIFVAPGLYKKEKRVLLPFLILTPLLFILGAAFVYICVLPVAWKFFIGFEQAATLTSLPIVLESKVDEYLSLVMQLIFAFGLAFELPIILILLVKIGITSSEGLKRKRRYAIVSAFVVAAVLTPPDPLSQIGLAIPIVLLYETSIMVASLMEKNKRKKGKKGADHV